MLWTLVLVCGLGAEPPALTFHWSAGQVEVLGLDAAALTQLETWTPDDPRWQRLLRVWVAADPPTSNAKTDSHPSPNSNSNSNSPVPAIAGRHAVIARAIRFTPAYRFLPDRTYEALVDPRVIGGEEPTPSIPIQTSRFTFPRVSASAPSRIEHVYPTRSILPENQLKFYVHFTEPMSRGHAYDFVRLLDETGKAVDLPFLAISEELWDAAGKRLTLLFDPGRVKRDLKPRAESGAILESGRRYTFEILAGWPDAEGRPLEKGLRKRFEAAEHDGRSPDWRAWRIESPRAGTREPLRVSFDEPLDHALLTRLPRVLDPSGRVVAGVAVSGDEERRWVFTPQGPWSAGAHVLAVDSSLEDLAGNRLDRVFDRDVFERIDDPAPSPSEIRRGFESRP